MKSSGTFRYGHLAFWMGVSLILVLSLCVPVSYAQAGDETLSNAGDISSVRNDEQTLQVYSFGNNADNESSDRSAPSDAVLPAHPSSTASSNLVLWKRLYGQSYFDTMETIVKTGFSSKRGGTVLVATSSGYWDALSASGVAGLYDAPILLTNPKKLSAKTKSELVRLKPKRVIIAGGTSAVSSSVASDIKKVTGAKVDRSWGKSATDTAAKLATDHFVKGKYTTAFVATSKGFQDALSASPIAYAKHYPIFLVENKNTISKTTLNAMKKCGVKRVIVVGGPSVVGDAVKQAIKKNGMTLDAPLYGKTAYDTSRAIANWGIKNGMTANRMGVATGSGYYDALCGAALCGKNKAVLVLADAKNYTTSSFASANRKSIKVGYVFGGPKAVNQTVWNVFTKASWSVSFLDGWWQSVGDSGCGYLYIKNGHITGYWNGNPFGYAARKTGESTIASFSRMNASQRKKVGEDGYVVHMGVYYIIRNSHQDMLEYRGTSPTLKDYSGSSSYWRISQPPAVIRKLVK